MKSLLLWNLLAGVLVGLHRSQSQSLESIQHSLDLHNQENIGHRYPGSTIVVNSGFAKRDSTSQRRASPRKGIIRSSSAPNLQYASSLPIPKEAKGSGPVSIPRIKTQTQASPVASRLSSAPNLKHDTELRLSRAKKQEPLQESHPRTSVHGEFPVGGSPVSSYRTPFSSIQGSPPSSPGYPAPNGLTRTTGFQGDRSDSSALTSFSTAAASSQPARSSGEMFTRQKIKPEPELKTPGKPAEKGFASRIGRPLLWVQNNPAKAFRIGASMTANAASGGAAIAAAHHNIPGAACLAIASAAMKVGIDCYDARDKMQTWHKQKGIDPKENAEATKRMVEAAKKPVSGLWRTISRPMSSQLSVEKPWPIDNLPVRKRDVD